MPVCAAAATGVFVGATIVATRFVIDQTDPASSAFLRYVVGFLCLLPVFLMLEKVSALFLIGLCCVALGLWFADWRPRSIEGS